MTKPGDLTPRQAAFVAEYLIDRNGTQAAIRAGYSPKTASSQAERLLRNAEVARAVAAGTAKIADKLEITAERVLRERARIAFADPRKIMHADGRIKLPNELDEETAAAIVSFKADPDGRFEYRFAGKDPSLLALEKRLGLNEKAMRFALPAATDLAGCAAAQESILQAVAEGALLPSEGQALAALVESKRRVIESNEIASRLDAIEKKLGIGKGP